MSAYSTLRVTRTKALEEVVRKLSGSFTDADLERFMDNELEPRLYNAKIVDDDAENDDSVV